MGYRLIKDNYNTFDMPTSNGSVAFANAIPSSNATQIVYYWRLVQLFLQKQICMNLHAELSQFPPSRPDKKPIRPASCSWGLSGGTAAAIAASFGAIGIKLRHLWLNPSCFNFWPEACCVFEHGIMPLSHTQDTAGSLARSLPDLAIILDLIAATTSMTRNRGDASKDETFF